MEARNKKYSTKHQHYRLTHHYWQCCICQSDNNDIIISHCLLFSQYKAVTNENAFKSFGLSQFQQLLQSVLLLLNHFLQHIISYIIFTPPPARLFVYCLSSLTSVNAPSQTVRITLHALKLNKHFASVYVISLDPEMYCLCSVFQPIGDAVLRPAGLTMDHPHSVSPVPADTKTLSSFSLHNFAIRITRSDRHERCITCSQKLVTASLVYHIKLNRRDFLSKLFNCLLNNANIIYESPFDGQLYRRYLCQKSLKSVDPFKSYNR